MDLMYMHVQYKIFLYGNLIISHHIDIYENVLGTKITK